jgi:hypothetical protein
VKLCYVFTGSIATGPYRYASTQSPSDSDCDDQKEVNLNLPPAVIDLTEGPSQPASNPKGKSKGKRKCEINLQSSHSSKRSTKGEEIYTRMYNEFERIADTVIRHLKISNSSPSIPTGQSTGLPTSLDPVAAVMRSVNVIADEISLPTSAYLDMCKQLNSPFWSSIVLNMTEK